MFDVVVVGGGPAGLSAALMLGRCRRRVLVLDLGQPRNRSSHALHGYLTRDGIAPSSFVELGRAELVQYGVELRAIGVTGAQLAGDHYRVSLSDGTEEDARYLLIATGVVDDLPAIPGFDECYGRSIFHCPYCDGWERRDRPLAAFGRGADVTGLALGLKTWSADVVVCTHGARLATPLRERLDRNGIQVRTEPIAQLEHVDGALSRHRVRLGRAAAARRAVLRDRAASAVEPGDHARLHPEPPRHREDRQRCATPTCRGSTSPATPRATRSSSSSRRPRG